MLELDHGALDRLVTRATGRTPLSITPMPGGASTRRFLRVATETGPLVAMFVPDAAPEEITTAGSEGSPARWPFLEVRDLLEARGVRVPRLIGEACEAGLVLLEDLTDDTLAAFLERAPARREEVYRLAITDLARAQAALEHLPEASIVRARSFDETLLRWELDHFREWGLDARGRALAPDDRAAFDAIADRLARRIASWPRGFVHRDYQSKNLMVRERPAAPPAEAGAAPRDALEIVWIDFQDALLGPRVYDLVALLNDSYQDLDDAFVAARLADYADAAGLDAGARAELCRQFDLMTVQRKLKDAGRFVFIDRVKKNPSFLAYIEPSLVKVRRALRRLEDDDDMQALGRVVGLLS